MSTSWFVCARSEGECDQILSRTFSCAGSEPAKNAMRFIILAKLLLLTIRVAVTTYKRIISIATLGMMFEREENINAWAKSPLQNFPQDISRLIQICFQVVEKMRAKTLDLIDFLLLRAGWKETIGVRFELANQLLTVLAMW